MVTGTTFSNTTISNLVMTNMQVSGIDICSNCGTAATSPTGNVWDHVLIIGNTITGNASGPNSAINVEVAWGDTLQHTIIANNNIVLLAQGALGIALGTPDQGSDIVLDTLVVNNTITATYGIVFRGGTALGSLYDGGQVIGNQISTTGGQGITLFPADVENGFVGTLVQPYNNNVIRNIAILANSIEGPADGIQIQAGQNAAANNAISNVSIVGNTLLNTVTGPVPAPSTGIFLFGGRSDYSAFVATGNSLSNVLIQANTIQSLAPPGNINFGGGMFDGAIFSGGISVYGGIGAQGNSINGISIANNEVNTPAVGIAVTGGAGGGSPTGGPPTFSADNNVVAEGQIFCNQVDQIPTLGVMPSSGIKGINVVAGLDEASGNQVQQVYVADNLVAGTLGGASTFSYLGSGGSGNTLTTSSRPTPAISLVANAEGQSPTIAPNTWIEIQGVNLAPNQDALTTRIWTDADFVNNQMPAELDGAGVTVNGKSTYAYYASPSQINALDAARCHLGTGERGGDQQRSTERAFRSAGAGSLALLFRFRWSAHCRDASGLHRHRPNHALPRPDHAGPARGNHRALRERVRTHVRGGGQRSGDAIGKFVADAGDHDRRNPGQRPIRRAERHAGRISVQRRCAYECSGRGPAGHSDVQRAQHADRRGGHSPALNQASTAII